MFDINGKTITMTAGDTGAFRVRPKYHFSDGDKAQFTIKNGSGIVVLRRWYNLDSQTETFLVCFHGQDTRGLAPGNYRWDIRYYLTPYYDGAGTTNDHIIDADQILTPYKPQAFVLEEPVGSL